MRHADLRKSLADYLEGDLPLEARALVDAHLDGCHDCAREVEEMRQTVQLLRGLPDPEPPPMITANVMRRIRAGESRPGFFERLGRALGGVLEPGFVLPASAIAAAALVVTVVQGPSPVVIDGVDFGAAVGGAGVGSEGTGGVGFGIAPRPPATSSAPARRDRWSNGRSPAAGMTQSRSFTATHSEERMRSSGETRSMAARAPAGNGARIRVEFEGVRGAQQTMSFGPLLTPRVSDQSTAGSSGGGSDWTMASPGRLVVAERMGLAPFVGGLGQPPIAQPQTLMQGGILPGEQSSGARDPRDSWLVRGLENPIEFARYIAGQNLAEQELWVARLAERAETRGLMQDLLRGLRESGDPTAAWVADDFAAEADRANLDSSASEGSVGH